MADSENNQKPGEPKELSMELRLLLAFILMGAVLFLTPYLFRSPDPPPGTTATPEPVAVAPAKPEAPAAPAPEAPSAPAVKAAAAEEQTLIVDTDVYRVTFSNRGAVVRSWILKNYRDAAGNQLELLNLPALEKVPAPMSVAFKEQQPAVDLNEALYAATVSEDGLQVDFEFGDGAIHSQKSFRFTQTGYLTRVLSEVAAGAATLPHYLVWRGGFGDTAIENSAAHQQAVYFDLTANELVTQEAKVARDAPVTFGGNFSFAGIQDAYFAAVALPVANIEIVAYNDVVTNVGTDREDPHVGIGLGGRGRNEFPFFAGPKNIDILQAVNPKLDKLVDFGWFSFIARPLFLALNWLNDTYIQNYGWSIVVITILINFALLPLKLTSMRSMKRMSALAPQIKAINERYKGVGLRDPKKAQQNQEIMDLYKKNNVNPMGGCMPMLLQIPFFIAFYKVLTVAIELRGAEWLWVRDLSSPEHLPIRILPVAMIVSQFVMQKMTPTTSMDPTQQRMMLMMPLFLGFMFYGVSSGLVLYWLTSNLVGIVQQVFINKTSPPAPVAAKPEPATAKSKRSAKK